MIRQAAAQGANIILLPELFETPYFCIDQKPEHLDLARPFTGNSMLERMGRIAAETNVVLPVSFFEKANTAYFNSVAVIDADGACLGVYRKTHIPAGIGYHEKYYFNPGDTGFLVFDTQYAKVGCGICWDQWFPETARILALKGAELICFPSAIGSEPEDPNYDSKDHWTRVMQGHAAANLTPVAASNRIGTEHGDNFSTTFYGSSFIAGFRGELIEQAARNTKQVVTAVFDKNAIHEMRSSWRYFRDRRTEHYGPLLGLDGK
jgi:N-carbamoylputrescine amidase